MIASAGRQTADSSVFDESQNVSSTPVDEHENFSDIDDVEVRLWFV